MHDQAFSGTNRLPVIDISALLNSGSTHNQVTKQIHEACCDFGFFYIVGHGVDELLQQRLEELSRRFLLSL